jgi:hypothetical protein
MRNKDIKLQAQLEQYGLLRTVSQKGVPLGLIFYPINKATILADAYGKGASGFRSCPSTVQFVYKHVLLWRLELIFICLNTKLKLQICTFSESFTCTVT